MTAQKALRPLAARRAGPLRGTAGVPGDKSVSHRALILGALAVGETKITGLLEAEDVLGTAQAMRRFGAEASRDPDGTWHVWGVGTGGFAEPDGVLDFGNSGTGARLAMGAMATTPISAIFTGDESLRRRPMKRVLEPLSKFGVEWRTRDGGLMPVALKGASHPVCIDIELVVASAQVKSALLLAALNAAGQTRISQGALTRDHTERMLKSFGADIIVEPHKDGETISLMGEANLKPAAVNVPRDPSSAAFPLVAALIVPESEISIPSVLLNLRRTGLLETLKEMGAEISISNRRESGGEETGDLRVRHSSLKAADISPARAPSMIDEYPVLAVAAAFAEGRTTLRGLEELRQKESDRLVAIAAGLRACGVTVEELPDGLIIEGRGADGVRGVACIETQMDHRIAMAFLVAGLAARESITIDDASMIATSFPGFEATMQALGAEWLEPK